MEFILALAVALVLFSCFLLGRWGRYAAGYEDGVKVGYDRGIKQCHDYLEDK